MEIAAISGKTAPMPEIPSFGQAAGWSNFIETPALPQKTPGLCPGRG